jgi:hypothetical protein
MTPSHLSAILDAIEAGKKATEGEWTSNEVGPWGGRGIFVAPKNADVARTFQTRVTSNSDEDCDNAIALEAMMNARPALIALLRDWLESGRRLRCEKPREYPEKNDGRSWAIQQDCDTCPNCLLMSRARKAVGVEG